MISLLVVSRKTECLSVNKLLHLWRIPRALDWDVGNSGFNSPKVLGSQDNSGSTDILFKTVHLGCARDRCNPGFLRQQPGDGDLRLGCVLGLRNFTEQLYQGLVGLPCFGLETGKGVTNVVTFEFRIFLDRTGQEAFAERAERHETDAQFL